MTKTILITGATDDIGLLTAKKLAASGHALLLHGRSEAKLAMARHDRLDVIINNAVVLKLPQARSEAGRDVRFDVNTIAPYILTRKLLPLLPSGEQKVSR